MILMVAGVAEVKLWTVGDDENVDPMLRGDESDFAGAAGAIATVFVVVDAVVFPLLLMLSLLLWGFMLEDCKRGCSRLFW